MFVVHSRVILRHDRPDCSVGRMRCGFILGRVCNCVFELFIWQVLVICIFDHLLELSFGGVSGDKWVHKLLDLPCWVILRHHWSDCSDRCLQCGDLLCILSVGVFELLGWFFSRNCRLFKLLGMHSGVILRHHWIVCSDWQLYCWDVFGFLGDCLLVLSRWHLRINGIFIELLELCIVYILIDYWSE